MEAQFATRDSTTVVEPPPSPSPPSRKRHGFNLWLDNIGCFQLLLAFRLLNALSIRTFFQPDEYYQALEPAWQLAFGESSAAWITWEWRQHLRSAIHPALFAIVYKLVGFTADLFSLSNPIRAELLLAAPKVLQATIAAAGDYYTWKLARRIYGKDSSASWAALVLTVINPWQWFCSTRTFSNCLETTLTIMALNDWPWDWTVSQREGESPVTSRLKLGGLRKALLYAAIATALRPTNVLIWISITVYTLAKASYAPEQGNSTRPDPTSTPTMQGNSSAWSKMIVLMREVILCGGAVLAVSALIDRFFYGSWTFPPYNFLYFNVLQSLAVFYGNNNWHYYLSEGYPLLLTISLPYAVISMVRVFNGYWSFRALPAVSQASLRGLAMTCILIPAALSILSHKEVRFIYPILPCLHIITALQASEMSLAFTTRQISDGYVRKRRTDKRKILVIVVLFNLFIAWYTTQIHNSGLTSLPDYLRHDFEQHYMPHSSPSAQVTSVTLDHDSQARNMTVAFLMPCHSLPWRSHLQYPATQAEIGIQAWALTCEPPLHLTDPSAKKAYKDEADIFYDDPKAWIRRNMARDLPPRHNSNGQEDNIKAGVRVADEAMGYRNKKLWDSSHLASSEPQNGLDITDLLPYLATSPNTTLDVQATSKPKLARRPWPDYIAFFDRLEPTLIQTLSSYRATHKSIPYSRCWRKFNSHFHDDHRRRGNIVVWCLNPPPGLSMDPQTALEAEMAERIAGTEAWREYFWGEGRFASWNKYFFGGTGGDSAVEDQGNRGGRQIVVGLGGIRLEGNKRTSERKAQTKGIQEQD